ncbi:MAG TPA: hypothetical protein VKT78_08765 [Fimbriimonadaceae bacterium]|nr:hypothetical protein [Fimbriimonadaceae bacterium]
METPPQFASGGPPPKKSNALLITVLVIIGVCVLCCVGIGVVFMNFFKKVGGSIGCITHYEFARKALSDYATANGGKLPPADTWQDAIIPYYGRDTGGQKANGAGIIDFGDATKDLGCPAENGEGPTGMAFNEDVAGKDVNELRKTPTTVVLFEVPQVGRNLHIPYKPPAGQSPLKIMGQPRDWITVPVSGSTNFNPNQSAGSGRGIGGL